MVTVPEAAYFIIYTFSVLGIGVWMERERRIRKEKSDKIIKSLKIVNYKKKVLK